MLRLVPDLIPEILPAPRGSGLEADIRKAADYAYTTIGEQKHVSPEYVHRMGVCLDATALMLKKMQAGGYDVERVVRQDQDIVHSYLVINGEIIVDPTWQQFRGGGIGSAPDVLVGTLPEVLETERAHGIGENVLRLYQTAGIEENIQQPYAEAA